MSVASAALEPPPLRLWGGSAIAVLLAHLAVAALLLWRLAPQAAPPVTPAGVDVDLAVLPAAASVAATLQRHVLPQRSNPVPHPIGPTRPLQPLQPVQQLATDEQATSSEQRSTEPTRPADQLADSTSGQAASAAEAAKSDLTALMPPPGADDVASPAQLWAAQVVARLARYKRYPPEAQRAHQQDTVQLQFSVDRSGAVLDSRVDSTHHYPALEEQVQSMVRSAEPLPPPPAELSGETIVMHVPVQFYLVKQGGSPPRPTCPIPATPGATPSGALATLDQMSAYRQRLTAYLAAARTYLDCLDQSPPIPAALAPARGRAAQSARQSSADHAQAQLPPTELLARGTVIDQMKELVSGFDVQANLFEATAKQKVQQAQIAAQQAAAERFAKVHAMDVRAYAACDLPAAPGHMPDGVALSAAGHSTEGMQAYRKALLAYATAVRTYVACVNRAHAGTLAAAGSDLTTAQRSQLDKDAAQIANAAIRPLNQDIAAFDARLRHTASGLPKHAGALLAALTGTWSMPSLSSLPRGNCVRLSYSNGRYQGTLCQSIVTTVQDTDSPAAGPLLGVGEATATYIYRVANLQVERDHVVLTISRVLEDSHGAAPPNIPETFDLTLSADGRRLSGTCVVDEITRPCHFDRR